MVADDGERGRRTAIDELVEHNRRIADGTTTRHVRRVPARAISIITCMDARIDLHAALGLAEGDAHILRNAGGVVTSDVIRSLAISQRLLGTREVMLVHHTDCGLENLAAEELAADLAACGETPDFDIGSFTDVDSAVRTAIGIVKASPFLVHRDDVRGFVYDVDTHRLTEIREPR